MVKAVATILVIAAFGGCQSGLNPAQAVNVLGDQTSHERRFGASREALIFAATGSDVYVLSYPKGALLSHLGVQAYALCSDSRGDVFIPTSGYEVREYSHEGELLQSLETVDVPLACAVDGRTGNLAVTEEGSGAGEVAVFTHAQGAPKFYRDSDIEAYGQCTYDDKGDLFVDGNGSCPRLAELRYGSGTFLDFPLGKQFVPYGGLQWYHNALTITNPVSHTVYALHVGDAIGIASKTGIRDWRNAYTNGWPYVETILYDRHFIAQTSLQARLGFWGYPQGGALLHRTLPFATRAMTIYGLSISVSS